MHLTLSVEHLDEGGGGTPRAEPVSISLDELAAIKSDVFRWLDGPGIGERLNDLRPNQVVVRDDNNGVMFSAFRT